MLGSQLKRSSALGHLDGLFVVIVYNTLRLFYKHFNKGRYKSYGDVKFMLNVSFLQMIG